MTERKRLPHLTFSGNGAEFFPYDNSFRAPRINAHYNIDGSLGVALITKYMSINPNSGKFHLFRIGPHLHSYLGEITSEVQRLELHKDYLFLKDMIVYTYQRAGVLHVIEEMKPNKKYHHYRIPSYLDTENPDQIQRILDEIPFGKIRERNLHLPD